MCRVVAFFAARGVAAAADGSGTMLEIRARSKK